MHTICFIKEIALGKHAYQRKRIWGKEYENFDKLKQKQMESTNVSQNANIEESQIHSTDLAFSVKHTFDCHKSRME